MGLRKCEKCEEMIDEAKAFCPGCGHAFVEEQVRQERSNFDTADHTMQLGQTMYNQMLSDMGLNISKKPDPTAKRTDVVGRVAAENKPGAVQKPSSRRTWIIAAIALVILFILLTIVIVASVFIYWFSV